jgi:hypothetical protein
MFSLKLSPYVIERFALFNQDSGDRYLLRQPTWEIVLCALNYVGTAKATDWTWKELDKGENQLAWKVIQWVDRPTGRAGRSECQLRLVCN